MTSWQTRAVCAVLRATRKRRYATVARGERLLERGGSPAAPVPRSLAGRVEVAQVGGRPVSTVRPPAAVGGPGALVYLHGGAFLSGIAPQHWRLVDRLATATGRPVHVPHYGLAPGATVRDAHHLLDVLADRLAPQAPLHLLGDSAGGNLALTAALRWADRPGVAGLTLVAPWLDLSMSNPGIDRVEPHDPWLSRAGLRSVAAHWADGHDLRDPAVSPLYADLDALPPTLVVVGSRDICLPDSELLAARSAGVRLDIVEGSPHVVPLLPTPEARAATERICRHVAATLGAVPRHEGAGAA